ncbi:MAG: AarF/UbiB family protein [Gemmatimonadota bacterium]|nr:AarF/UbiB family protein [Gemmatimonadota bacterium]
MISLGELDANEPPDVAYTALTESGAALPIPKVQPLVEQALRGPIDERFRFFAPVGIAASIGQVHRAEVGAMLASELDYTREAAAALRTPVMTRDTLDPRTPALAPYLKIRVTEAGAPKVTLTFPGRCADTSQELMPDDLRARLADEGTDLAGIVERSAKRGQTPGVLFESHHAQQLVRVWLE